jgi:hypothetical protein
MVSAESEGKRQMRIEWTPEGWNGKMFTGTVDPNGCIEWDEIKDSSHVTLDYLRKVAAKGGGTLKEIEAQS